MPSYYSPPATAGSGSGDALTTDPLNQFASTTSAQLRSVLSDESGTGVAYFAGGNAGTPSAIVLTNATGMPVAGVTGLASGVATFLATPSSANLLAALTDSIGGGLVVFNESPDFAQPGLGAATADSVTLLSDTAYNETTWNGDLSVPTKNALRDKIESISVGGFDEGGDYELTGEWDFSAAAVAFGTIAMPLVLGTATTTDGSIILHNAVNSSTVTITGGGVTGDLTLFMPAATGTHSLVSLTATQALTNKTVNKLTITAPATGSTLTILDGKTLTVNHSLTFAGTDSTTMTFPTTSASIARTDAAQTFTGVQTMTAPVFNTKAQLPTAAGSSTLTTGGDCAYNTTNKILGIHNGTKEVGISTIYRKEWSFDPKAVCDGAVDRLFLMKLGVSEPFGIHIVGWNLSFEADPTTEVDLDLKRADAFIGVANAAVMDVLDTTSGVSSEGTSSNINSDAVVANGKVIYLEFGTAYSETTHQIIFEMFYELEED